MEWELRHVEDVECGLDDSGIYTVINRVKTTKTFKDMIGDFYMVRVDVMMHGDEPLVSFQGSANVVRKHLMRWLFLTGRSISLEHASYIGYELLRAETTENFIQD